MAAAPLIDRPPEELEPELEPDPEPLPLLLSLLVLGAGASCDAGSEVASVTLWSPSWPVPIITCWPCEGTPLTTRNAIAGPGWKMFELGGMLDT